MDARFKTDEGRLKLRVSGIIIHDNKILIEKYAGDIYFLPGGTVNLNETSEDAIRRELKDIKLAPKEIKKEIINDKYDIHHIIEDV